MHVKFINLHLRAISSILFPRFIPNSSPQAPLQKGELLPSLFEPIPSGQSRAFALPRDPRALAVYITSSESVQIPLVSSLSLQGGLSGYRHSQSCSPGLWFRIGIDFSGTA